MSRMDERAARTQRSTAIEEENTYQPEAEGTVRRRRTQAARLQSEGVIAPADAPPDPIAPPQSYARYARPQQPARPQRYVQDDDLDIGYGASSYTNPDDLPDDHYSEDDDWEKEEKRPRRRIVVWAIVITLLVLLLAGATYVGLTRPDMVGTVMDWGRNLFVQATPTPEPTLEPTPAPTPEPTPEPTPFVTVGDAMVVALLAEPLEQPDLNAPVRFQVTTTQSTTRVQVVDQNGQVLNEGWGDGYTEVNELRIWNLDCYFLEPYDGTIEVFPGNDAGWNTERVATTHIQVGQNELPPVEQPTQTPEQPPVSPVDTETTPAPQPIAAQSTDVTTTLFVNNEETTSFAREIAIDIQGADGYNKMNGVLGYRSSGMRQNAAYGTIAPEALQLESVWSATAGIAGDAAERAASQPLIAQWHSNLRPMMTFLGDYADQIMLKEVIFAGNDGQLYFYEMETGEPTRDAILLNPAMPMLGSPAIYSDGFPMLFVGTGTPGSEIPEDFTGMLVYDLVSRVLLGPINGQNDNAFSPDRSFITSPVLDPVADVMTIVGGNGLLYTLTFKRQIDKDTGVIGVEPTIEIYRSQGSDEDVAVDSALAAYGELAYYANNGGILQCVNLNTLTPVWAVDLGADTDAALALDGAGDQVALYALSLADENGFGHVRRLDALTGEVAWDITVSGDIKAAPLVGVQGLADLLIIAAEDEQAVYALDKNTGAVVWERPVQARPSSPIALYTAEGVGYVAVGDSTGLYLLDGLTGEELHFLAIEGGVVGSPAAFDEMILLSSDDGQLHALRVK